MTQPARKKRLTSEERRQDILDKAIRFFASNGLDSSTRDLARELGVTQPLLYRYFPSKDALIEEVYQAVYVNRWKPHWDVLLTDRARPLRDRLLDFYREYTDAIFAPEWLRIYFYSALRGEQINRNYVALVQERILRRIVIESHAERGVPAAEPTEHEMELVWIMHGGIFYFGVRKIIFDAPVHDCKSGVIRNAVETFLTGIEGLERNS